MQRPKLKQLTGSPSLRSAAIAAGVSLAVGAGGAEAAHRLIVTGGNIKNRTVRSVDIKNNSLLSRDIKNGTIRSRDITDGKLRGRDIHDSTITADKLTKGVQKKLDAQGKPGPQGPPGPSVGDGKAEYGVVQLYLDHAGTKTLVGTLSTSDVPDDHHNPAQASTTVAVPNVADGDTIEAYGAVRSEETAVDGKGGQMGASLTVTSSTDGSLLGSDQTPVAPGTDVRGKTRTVTVPSLALNSNGPTDTTGAELAKVTVATAPANGTVVVSSTGDAYDFFTS